jgi:hypothetical protein
VAGAYQRLAAVGDVVAGSRLEVATAGDGDGALREPRPLFDSTDAVGRP